MPEMGIEAIFAVAEFQQGLQKYMNGLGLGESKTDESAGKMNQALTGLSNVGFAVVTAGAAAVAASVTAVAGAMIASIPATLDWAEKLDGIGDVLGTSSQESAALAVAIEGVGGNAEAITGQMAFLTRGLVGAKGELGPTGQALKDLGIGFKDAQGNILPATDILQAVADKIGVLPDGLEKTKLMTQLFGKSGKDLSDVMGALANGGLAAADEKAKALGLSMSDEATAGAIELGRQFKTLQQMGQGLFVQLGSKLLPILSPLIKKFTDLAYKALPTVQKWIGKLADIVSKLVDTAMQELPKFFETMQKGFDWISKHKEVIVGALAAITVAIAAWAYTTIAAAIPAMVAFVTAAAPVIAIMAVVGVAAALLYKAWTSNFGGIQDKLKAVWDWMQPIFNQLKTWLQTNIPAAIQVLTNFWNNTLLPVIKTVWTWVQQNVFPIAQTLWNWLATNLPAAISTLSNWWNNTLLPAIKAVGNWINTYLTPFFKSLAEVGLAVVQKASEAIAGLWQNVLLPAFQSVGKYVSETIVPKLKEFGDYLGKTFQPLIEPVAKFISDKLAAAFKTLSDWIQKAADFLHDLAQSILGLQLPDWLTPGSPTPLEMGIRGISAATQQLANLALPSLNASLNVMRTSPLAAQSQQLTPAASNVTSITNNYDFGRNNVSAPMDLAMLQYAVRQVLQGEL